MTTNRIVDGPADRRHVVFERMVRFNLLALSLTMGTMGGILLWLATAILLWRGGSNVGAHLGLLAVFLPGYSVSWAGALVGLFWGFVGGAAVGAMLYLIYARRLRLGVADQTVERPGGEGLRPPVMLLSGTALGAAIGGLGALQLIATTNWLVLRGTAPYSQNAALLGQYLPGYTVTFVGSLIGAVQVFGLGFVASVLVAFAYNRIARWRARS